MSSKKKASAAAADDAGGNVFSEKFGLPFQFIRCPHMKIRTPNLAWRPSSLLVFCLAFASYFLVLSGLIYDVIVEPPSIGSTRDPDTGAVRPVAFLQYRVNGQYIIEGLSAGFFFALGGLGFILLDKSNSATMNLNNRYLLLISGILCVAVSYNICQVFIRMKIPVSLGPP